MLGGYRWREAILAVEEKPPTFGVEAVALYNKHGWSYIEKDMFDKETGQSVGNTRNFCIKSSCGHEDCGPCVLLFDDGYEDGEDCWCGPIPTVEDCPANPCCNCTAACL